ncbi:XRE family transcriptional regulator [Enterococcus sp. BWB1-3]|uniref:spr1629 family repressor/antitoxin n=1 Tax=Enterococcus sp. BWB1-3 TaxID=2787713 RepID=UPI00192219E2|nr:XRE family transcriptional regulator [Enterococcus sp. BWB1-3]MBL1228028.1 XRE family transcriptional regulator [Enterococcus sp. BWB1-3]
MFYGKNLQIVRMLHGLSRKELGDKLNVSEQSIWQFEKDMIEPSFENILQLREILQVKTAFFFEPFSISKTFSETNVAYRKADSSSRKKTNSEVVYLNVVSEVIHYLEGYLNAPKNTLIALRTIIGKELIGELTNEKIEAAAAITRDFLVIQQNNANLLLALEKSGIHVLEKNVGGKADAYSAWSTEDIPIIVLGIKKSAVRRNFDLAHELGHLLLHSHIDFLGLEKNERQQIEREADYFASCLLLPEQLLRTEFKAIKKISNPDSYIPLKAKYNVSVQALEMRAYKLGFLTPKQHSYFYRQISIKGYRLEEPLDKEIALKRPGKIRSIFNLILTNQITDLRSIEDHFKMERRLIEEMFSIEPEFFSPYEKQDNFTDFNNVLRANFGSL